MLADIVDVADDVVIPEAQNGPAILFQTHCPCLVTGESIALRMLGAIGFNDEFLLRASEVDNVTAIGNCRRKPSPSTGAREARSRAFNSADVMTLRIDLAFARWFGGNGV